MGIGLLLEGFAPAAAADPFEGAFTSGDQVRVSVKGSQGIVGRVVRPHGGPPATHAVIAPEGGGAHVLAPVASVKLNTPAQHAAVKRRRDAAEAKQAQQQLAARGKQPVGMPKLPASGSVLEGLLEAFAPPAETPQQSAQIAQGQYTQAQKGLAAGWNASKHPRAQGGKFGYTTGGKRATSGAVPRTVSQGSHGALVKSLQRQLGLPADGVFGPNTKAAVVRFQQQHGLLVDGIIGRQTLAALRGKAGVTPGPITASTARLKTRKAKASKAPPAPVRLGGGVLIR